MPVKLRQAFREIVASSLPVIEEALAKLKMREPGAVETLRRVAHQLRTSGVSHGFPSVAEAASALQTGGSDPERDTARLLDALQDVLASVPAQRRTVLLVDDDPVVTTLLSAALSSSDRTVAIASCWTDAETQLQSLRPSLVVLDLVLPDADGRNALIWLREQPHTAAIPIFILSGGTGGSVPVAECLALGATRYIAKPFNLKDVASAADAALRDSNMLDWRVDLRTGLLTRAGFKDQFTRAADPSHFIASIGTSSGGPLPLRAATELAESAGDTQWFAAWDADTVAAMIVETTSGDAARRLEKLLASVEQHCGVGLVAGMSDRSAGEPLEDALGRAQHRQALARSAGATLAASEQGTETPIVLLAEDDPVVSHLVRDRLRRAGMDVVHVEDGRKALAAARDTRFACAILDVKLPALDGFALLAELRKEPKHARLPVAMLTSMGQEKDVMRGFELGADDYIVKPFSPRELAARIQRLVDRGLAPVR